jgi:hypothetical protein
VTRRLLTVALTLAGLVLGAAPALAAPEARPGRAAKPKVSVTVPGEVTEGDRYEVTVKLSGPVRGARQLLVQRLTKDAVWGTTNWETVRKTKVRGKKKFVVGAVAGEADTDAYRARLLFTDRKAVASRLGRTTVWHWYALTGFAEYDDSYGTLSGSGFAMNGLQRKGWSTYSSYPSYQTGWTLGRHCRALRGEVGVTDSSKPGTSAALQVVADETTTVFSSGPLTPGMTQPVQVDLATPYRLQLRAQDTSPDKLQAYPAFGSPEVLCTGVS